MWNLKFFSYSKLSGRVVL